MDKRDLEPVTQPYRAKTLSCVLDQSVRVGSVPHRGRLLLQQQTYIRTCKAGRLNGGGFCSQIFDRVKQQQLIFYNHIFSDRYACAIPDSDNEEVIITGGWWTLKTVSVYTKDGHKRDLPDLRTERREHACSSFIYEDTKVK